MAAQYPPIRPIFPPTALPAGAPVPPKGGGGEVWMEWFQNYKAGNSMNPETTYSTDFSFQVAIGLENFYAAKAAQMQGEWAEEYQRIRTPIARGGITK